MPAKVGVYISRKKIIYDASLNQTNIGGNNNKVCRHATYFSSLVAPLHPVMFVQVMLQRPPNILVVWNI
jgi:hypothetical protein